MRTLKITFIVFIIVGLVGILSGFIAYGFNVREMYSDMSLTGNYEGREEMFMDVNTLSVNVRNGRINLNTHDQRYVRVTYYTREDRLIVTTQNVAGVLTITQERERSRWNFINVGFQSSRMYEVNIWVPASVDTATLISHNGRISVSDVAIENMTVTSHNGRVDLDNIESTALTVTSHNGRVNLSNSDVNTVNITSHNGMIDVNRTVGEKITLRNHNGRNNIYRGTFTSVDVRTSNGRNDVRLVGNQSDYQINFITHNGSTRLNGNRTSQSQFEGGPGSIRMETRNGRNDLRFV